MKRSTTQVGRRMDMLPLEKWIAEERSRSGTMRPLGEVVADVVEKAGRPHQGGGRKIGPTGSQGGGVAPRSETGDKGTDAEAPASSTGAIKHRGEPVVNCDVLPNTMLDRQMATHAGSVVVVVMCQCSEPEHYAGSETWIEF
tara:strand:- start:502 stop:927 length:426 start_codon:yes stop_codon:yes gene_type:complete